jgi:antitoxin component YwqK of YwqJK toxin-antitoxin module
LRRFITVGSTGARASPEAKFDRNGTIESAESDDNFDGVFESQTIYRLGNPQLIETDTDGDGYRDFKMNFVNGVLVSDEYIYPTTGLPQKIDYFKSGRLTHSETDTDKDGKMDKRTNYNGLGEVASVENIR